MKELFWRKGKGFINEGQKKFFHKIFLQEAASCRFVDGVIEFLVLKNTKLTSLENILIHSDQGFHYTNPLYISMIKDLNMIQSMSRKGNCIDNAPIESFFGHLKDDVDYKHCKTFEELYSLIHEYVRYYNNDRRQWDLKKMTPVDYRDHLLAAAG